jgi:hypothetical protein
VKVVRRREERGRDINGEGSDLRWTRKECGSGGGFALQGSYRFTVTREWGGGAGGHDEEIELEVEPENTPAARCWLRRKEAVPGLRN